MNIIGLITIITFLIDRLLKIIISSNFKINYSYKIIDKFFYITNCHNKGAAFSILNNNVIFLILVSIIVLVFILKLIKKNNNASIFLKICYGILLGGILGNLFDRIFLGYVIDYLDFILFGFDFAIFNFADMCIVISVILLLFIEKGEKI